MSYLFETTLIGLFFGTFGTTLGGIIGVCLKTTSNKFLSIVLSFASGLMLSIVCFDLIPESMELTSMLNTVVGVICGVICMMMCDVLVNRKFSIKNNSNTKNNLLKTGIIVSIGLALHNFPEGLAIGSGFETSITLGYSLALAICLHDIPEGIAMGVPMKNGGMKISKVIFYVIMSGVTTGIGAFFGALVGTIGKEVIAMCLAFAGGAMLYIVSGELIPESNNLYKGKLPVVGNVIGFIIGMFATRL